MKRFLLLALTVMSLAVAMSIPSSSASAADGAVNINTTKFIGYTCYYHRQSMNGPQYQCYGGVYIKPTGDRRYGTKCVMNDYEWGWVWMDRPCVG